MARHIPYKGGGAITTALLGNEVDVAFVASCGEAAWQKPLGTFGDRELRVSMLKWGPGGVHDLRQDRTQFVFTLRGEVEFEGKRFTAPAAITCEIGFTAQVRGVGEAEALCVTMPLGPCAGS